MNGLNFYDAHFDFMQDTEWLLCQQLGSISLNKGRLKSIHCMIVLILTLPQFDLVPVFWKKS